MKFFDKVKVLTLLTRIYWRIDMKNWKTTLFGCLTAAGLGMINSEDATVKLIGQLLSVISPIIWAVYTKDKNVTGGNVPQ